jgi:hypothetical protein
MNTVFGSRRLMRIVKDVSYVGLFYLVVLTPRFWVKQNRMYSTYSAWGHVLCLFHLGNFVSKLAVIFCKRLRWWEVQKRVKGNKGLKVCALKIYNTPSFKRWTVEMLKPQNRSQLWNYVVLLVRLLLQTRNYTIVSGYKLEGRGFETQWGQI